MELRAKRMCVRRWGRRTAMMCMRVRVLYTLSPDGFSQLVTNKLYPSVATDCHPQLARNAANFVRVVFPAARFHHTDEYHLAHCADIFTSVLFGCKLNRRITQHNGWKKLGRAFGHLSSSSA